MNKAGQSEQNSKMDTKARNLAIIKDGGIRRKGGHGDFFFFLQRMKTVKGRVKKAPFL